MARKSTGSVKWMRNVVTGVWHWHARWSKGKGKRTKYIGIDPNIPEDNRDAALACAAKWAHEARTSAGEGTIEPVEKYADRWLADREKRVVSIKDDRARLRDHVLPTLGPLDVRIFNRDDVEGVRDALDEKVRRGELSWKTAGNVWTVLKAMCGDTANARNRELRVRDDDPAAGVKPPLRGARKEKQYLYPSEFLAFLGHPEVPRTWKIAACLALYSYGRDGEVAKLDWRDIDLEHGILRITRARDRDTGGEKSTKTGGTRRFSVEPNLLPLLRTMHQAAGGKGTVFEFDATHLSRTFRRWLLVAGVKRHELHTTTTTSRAITWHDLRASAATWMAVRGDKPLVIRQRCGHAAFTTTELYIREAEVLSDGFGEVFPALPANCHPIATGSRRLPKLPRLQTLTERDTGLEAGSESVETAGKQGDPSTSPETQLPRLDEQSGQPSEETAHLVDTRSRNRVAEIESAIARLTRQLATAPDATITELVEELRAQRRDLEDEKRRALPDNVVDLSSRKRS